ncbi:ATP-dependent zinc protease [Franzmannia qiaohouensis]|uniref:ATP-dependent zinc protease n=1 Tax=Franzmannia qiaohouensis TaxID=1329370 RepID=A0ABU1HG95_9GAMM|nr:ATP-dependent zinc protease [Halomonas qiaohouensis]MDR5905869.1 ATP-dependent zinc protease [Halomonas qiaohouensis]
MSIVMRIRRAFPATALAIPALLGGCALLQGEPEPPPEPALTQMQFESRVVQLEQQLAERCDVHHQLLTENANDTRRLTADVREVGSLLRDIRSDIDLLADEPVIIPAQCEEDAESPLDNKEILGRSEWIGLPDVGTYLKARVDSGASTSSLSATDITRFERDGDTWVRFKLALGEDDVVVEQVRDEWIEAPVIRRVRILQAAGEESRPVVRMMMTLGPIREQVEFTLNDRSHLNYPVLLGRRFMMDIAMIDVAETYLHPRPEFPGGRPADEASEDEVMDDDENEANGDES